MEPPKAPNKGVAEVEDVTAAACPALDCADPKPLKPAGVDAAVVVAVPLP